MANGYDGYSHPNHGRNIFREYGDSIRPGYGLYDRSIDAFRTN